MPSDQPIPGPEQLARYRQIQTILRAYTKGEATMTEVQAIPREEILACRQWVNDASVRALIEELPDLGVYED